jgi:hypothetical protein
LATIAAACAVINTHFGRTLLSVGRATLLAGFPARAPFVKYSDN